MLERSAEFMEGAAKRMGVPLRIPRPGKKMRRASVVTNTAFGVGLVTAGALVSSKALIGLGALGLAGAVMMAGKK